ncbi:MAG: glycine cleavage system protein H [Planctomycetaceae bacterium]|nr:glycine cleavage system protein H [Planctomycetaceae bacterium]
MSSETPFFLMGQYKALIPVDRSYSPRHLWLQETTPGLYRVGFTSYSVRLLQDVYFLEWSIDPGTDVRERQEIGEIESSKAVSSLFPPCAGTVVELNAELLNDPSAINADNYQRGWLYTFRTDASLLTTEDYLKVLQDGWEKAQRTIKGQINEDM